METLSIASKKPLSMKPVDSVLAEDWRVETLPDSTLVVHGPRSRAYLHPDAESDNLGEYRLLLDYSDVELAKSILEKIANDSALTVINDFGTVPPGNEFVSRCKTKAGWDWRQSPTE